MWLLNTSTYQLVFMQHPPEAHYAVLSHVWAPDGEQTFQDVHAIHTAARSSFPDALEDTDPHLLDAIRAQLTPKIRCCCDYARTHGYAYLWIDTCCIDKTSSAELSEAINSMFTWYSQAAVCYVFLCDVSAGDDPAAQNSSFRRSMWFKRGWTLKELIVPSRNVFLAKDWRMIGTKTSLTNVIKDVTGIGADVLLHTRQLHTVSVAERMSWAAGRETTRVEDEAYCLMGVFGVRLSVIYGEGSQAFVRLQEEIMRRIPDQSLFLWQAQPYFYYGFWRFMTSVPSNNLRASKSAYLFASCPTDFSSSKGFSPIPLGTFGSMLGLPGASRPPLYTPSSYGVRTTFPTCTLICPNTGADGHVEVQLALLACQDVLGRIPALLLSSESASSQHMVGGVRFEDSWYEPVIAYKDQLKERRVQTCPTQIIQPPPAATVRYFQSYPRIIFLEPSMLKNAEIVASMALRDVCIPHQRMAGVSELAVLRRPPRGESHLFRGRCQITLPCWTLEHLSALGYSTNVVVKNGEMVPVSLSPQPRLGGSDPRGTQWSHTFTLRHTTRGPITVTVSTCPSPSHFASMHASVAWGLESNSDAQRGTQAQPPLIELAGPELEAQCTREHVGSWTRGRKRFAGPPGSPAVLLHFAVWDSDEDLEHGLTQEHGSRGSGLFSGDYYALDIRAELPRKRTANAAVSSRSSQQRTSVDLAGVDGNSLAAEDAVIANANGMPLSACGTSGALPKTDADAGIQPPPVPPANVHSSNLPAPVVPAAPCQPAPTKGMKEEGPSN